MSPLSMLILESFFPHQSCLRVCQFLLIFSKNQLFSFADFLYSLSILYFINFYSVISFLLLALGLVLLSLFFWCFKVKGY